MADPTQEVSIDGVVYPLLSVSGAIQWQIESEGQELEILLDDWTRGLGIDFIASEGIDTTSPGLLRLPPAVGTYVGAANIPVTTGAVDAWFEEMSAGGKKFLYYVGFQDAATDQMYTRKINITPFTNPAFEADVNHFSGAFAASLYGAGKPERFEKEWAVCWRDSTLGRFFRVLQTVGEPGVPDTWVTAGAGNFGGAFSQVQEEGAAKLAKAYNTNLVAKASVDPELLASWASGFEVGDNSIPISTVLEISGYLVVVKPDGIYLFDRQGFSYLSMIPLIRRRASKLVSAVTTATVDDWDGIGSTLWHKMVLLLHETGAFLIDPLSGGRPLAIGLEALRPFWPRTGNLDSSALISSRPYWAATFGDAIYLIQHDTTGSGDTILYGYPSNGKSPAPFIWHVIHEMGENIGQPFITSDQQLWFRSTGVHRYIQLAADGSPITPLGSNRGLVGSSANIYLCKDGKLIDFGQTSHQFQLRQMGVFIEGQVAGKTSVGLYVYRDGGVAKETVAAAITSDGYQEADWTPGTNDLAYFVIPTIQITTGGTYVPATSDPRIRYVVVRARSPDIITCLIDMRIEALLEYGLTPQQANQNLSRLKNASRKTIIEPGPVQTSYSGEIFSVSRRQQSTQEGTFDVLEVKHRRWSTA